MLAEGEVLQALEEQEEMAWITCAQRLWCQWLFSIVQELQMHILRINLTKLQNIDCQIEVFVDLIGV